LKNNLESIFLDENYLTILYEIYENKDLISIVDLHNMFILFISCLIQTTDNKVGNALKNIGIVDNIIKIFGENKIHRNILASIMDLVLYIEKSRCKIIDDNQV